MIQIDVVMPRLFSEGRGELRLNLSIQPGTLTALIGPSGSGKTSFLRLLAGLETPERGRIVVDGDLWLDTDSNQNRPPQSRSIGYVFQDTALFPNMTVRQNIQFAAPAGQEALIQELMVATGIQPFGQTKPDALSGGQRQRVALARALVRRPKLLLLDEPFAALDAVSSQQLREVLLDLHKAWGVTTLLVSHHEADVDRLADRVVQLVQGRVETDRWVKDRKAVTSITEPILRIAFDELSNVWVIETATTQFRSANPAWKEWKVGDLIQVARTATSG